MHDFAVYYILANCVSILMFGILLAFNRSSIDRQEKQIKFDRALIAFILYFVADCFWAAIVSELIPKTRFTVVCDVFVIYLCMAAITYFWLEYVLAVEQVPGRLQPRNRVLLVLPFVAATAALILNYLIAPQMLLDEALDARPLFGVYLTVVPVLNILMILFYTLRRARAEENFAEKRRHLFVGLLPLTVLISGLIQQFFFPYLPIFCGVSMFLMLTFYIFSVQDQVSLDPLTGLNNRGQLSRYLSQKSNFHMDNRRTAVAMMDIDRFKTINDTYGHAEGDRALVLVADTLKKIIADAQIPSFLGRYGGDEFILILHPEAGEDCDRLLTGLRGEMDARLREIELPYTLAVSLGYDALGAEGDSIQDCILRADRNLYRNKATHR